MTDDDLRAIEERANAATAGPWLYGEAKLNLLRLVWPMSNRDRLIAVEHRDHRATAEDCVFIAHARSDVPRLVAEVRRLRDTHCYTCASEGVPGGCPGAGGEGSWTEGMP